MSTNPYAPPTAAVSDISALRHGEAASEFFAVSLTKLVVLSLCSLGFYEVYWFYKNWRLIRRREQSGISPVPRAIFAIIFCYPCFACMRDRGVQLGVAPPLTAGLLATGWILTTIAWRLPGPYWLITLLAVVFLLPVQAHANRVNRLVAPNHDPNARFSGWNWVLIVVGGALLALAIIGTLVPGK